MFTRQKFVPYLLILVVGFLSQTLTATDTHAQERCEHFHQFSKKLVAKQIQIESCFLCSCEKVETLVTTSHIKAAILADCDCDETNDAECGKSHGHPNSADGEWEARNCIWGDPSIGIPDNSMFDAIIVRRIKYCVDASDNFGLASPRAGHHSGIWRILSGLDGQLLACGSLQGLDGVDPSYERSYTSETRSAHATLPGGQPNPNIGPDFCDGSECYLPGWQSGVILGNTTDRFFRYQCPPPGTYDMTEVANIQDCSPDGTFVILDSSGKLICITPTANWKLKACYSGGNQINPSKNPCEQWGDDWSVRLEGVIYISACNP